MSSSFLDYWFFLVASLHLSLVCLVQNAPFLILIWWWWLQYSYILQHIITTAANKVKWVFVYSKSRLLHNDNKKYFLGLQKIPLRVFGFGTLPWSFGNNAMHSMGFPLTSPRREEPHSLDVFLDDALVFLSLWLHICCCCWVL